MTAVNSNQGQSGLTPFGGLLVGGAAGAAPGFALAHIGKRGEAHNAVTRDQLNSADQAIERRGNLNAARADLADIAEGRWMVRNSDGSKFGIVGATTKDAQSTILSALHSSGTADARAVLSDGARTAQRAVQGLGRLHLGGEFLGVAGLALGAGFGYALNVGD